MVPKSLSRELLQREFDRLLAEGTRLAGGLKDLPQRAATYHHLYEHSQGNHVFPLIAAHGALWAKGYFEFGMKLGRTLVWQYGLSPAKREQQLESLERFADAFREVNRRVCVETYASYHFTAKYGNHPLAGEFFGERQLTALNRVHASRDTGEEFTDADRREVFLAHFLDEQQRVVGPSLELAVADFRWPLMQFIALQPVVKFAYFGGQRMWFRNFLRREERIAKGLRAFDIAAAAGWRYVEACLKHYAVMPDAFFANSAAHFDGIRASLLAA